jgi:hypothetical protein
LWRAVWWKLGVRGVEDDVVAFAFAEGFGDAEALAGGGQGEG